MTDKPLLDLSVPEAIALAQMAQQPGWKIFLRIMNAECESSNKAVIRLDPTSDGYEKKLVALQTVARSKNEFCNSLEKNMAWYTKLAIGEIQKSDPLTIVEEPKHRFVIKQPVPTVQQTNSAKAVQK